MYDALLVVAGAARATKVSPLTLASTAEQLVGKNFKFWYCADQDTHIRFGDTGMAAADDNDMYIPSKTPIMLDTGFDASAFRVYNPSGSTANIYYVRMSQF